MTSAAQIAANQQNSKLSTGPRTDAGKQASSNNARKFGLFSAQNCIHPHEQEEYDQMSAGLLEELTPVGNIETMFATEVVRCSWRLRRCATAEAQLGELTEDSRLDPSIVPETAKQQAAIDRARSSAQNGLRRAFITLSNRQNQRLFKENTVVRIDTGQTGIANVQAIEQADQLARQNGLVSAAKQTHPIAPAAPPKAPTAKQSQPQPSAAAQKEHPRAA